MAQAETNGLHNDQWGSRPNRTSTDPALRKMMTFEYGRYMKATIAVFLSDQTACFDRMHPGVTNIIAQSHGMDPAPCLCQTKTIDSSQRHIRTALGVSSGSYKDTPPTKFWAWSKATQQLQAYGPYPALPFSAPMTSYIPV